MVPPIDYFAQGTELISVRDAFLAMSDFIWGFANQAGDAS